MAQIPFVSDAYRGEVPVNFYPEIDQEKGKTLFGTPGLLQFCQQTTGGANCGEVRAVHRMGNYLYAIAVRTKGQEGSAVFKIAKDGTFTEIGSMMSTNEPVFIIDNGNQLMFVDKTKGYVYNIPPVGPPTAPAATLVITATGNCTNGAHLVKTTYTTPNGETNGSAASASVTVGISSAPPAAPTAALVATATGVCTNGAHLVKVTYITPAGESGGSDASASVTVDGTHKQILVTMNGTPPTGVTHWKVYMTEAAGATYKLVTTTAIAIATTTYQINLIDAGLGAEIDAADTTNKQILVTHIGVAPGMATHWNVYMTEAAGSTYKLVAAVAITTLTYQINMADGSLGATMPTTDTTGLEFDDIADTDFPGSSAAAYIDGYGLFIRPETGQLCWTLLYDFAAIDALDFVTAEGSPDNLVSLLVDHREVWLYGEDTTEIWYNSGGASTFERISGGYLEQGCAARCSPAKMDNSVYWLSDKGQILRAEGYQPVIASSRKFDREVAGYSRIDDAIGYAYTGLGHSFYVLTFPTAGVTWVYDAATQLLHKRASWQDGEAESGRHRANCYAYFDRKHLVGDYANGRIYEMSTDYPTDHEYAIIRDIYSTEFRNEGKLMFYGGVELQLDVIFPSDGWLNWFVAGWMIDWFNAYWNNEIEVKASLSWSDSGGYKWSAWTDEDTIVVGKLGEYNRRAIWRRLGSSRNRIFRVRFSDPVIWRVLSANMV